MQATIPFAYVIFFLVPLAFWGGLTAITQRGNKRTLSAVVTGHDGRLSLSRLQAFAWTLLIAGAYCAAMAVHPKIEIATEKEKTAREAVYNAAVTKLAAAKAALVLKETDLAAKRAEYDAAPDAAHALVYAAARRAREAAQLEVRLAELAHEVAKTAWRATQWVRIPNPLLALAGISLATGVFASVISASDGNAPPPVPVITSITFAPNVVTVVGTGFGSAPAGSPPPGEVRLNGRAVTVDPAKWTDTNIEAPVNAGVYKTVVVDTAGGKDAHAITGTNPQQLGDAIVLLEWRDLLREDSDPTRVSLTKFQMLGWTCIAIVFFVVIILLNLRPSIDELPSLDPTLVALTGLSQSGYLGGKMVKG